MASQTCKNSLDALVGNSVMNKVIIAGILGDEIRIWQHNMQPHHATHLVNCVALLAVSKR